jgi:hypothetical protein
VISDAKDNPLQTPSVGDLPPQQASAVESASVSGAENGFHLAMLVAGVLMIAGGTVAGIWLRNPKRETEYDAPGAAAAGECAHCPDHLDDTAPGDREREHEPVAEPA